jgi:hypothetical protein
MEQDTRHIPMEDLVDGITGRPHRQAIAEARKPGPRDPNRVPYQITRQSTLNLAARALVVYGD